ncbi:tetratricopeptide repeat protein [Methylobacterium sp. Leaf108]|uniref:tetratricopeptide repeat protein n=1 Tax=Methylobacterium sp. Leaf108 TaxID=1736256 RepID=UPI0006F74BEB|nr:tetratricopeptide repeat protein [Methylobacterium sp. Leaf108]KQP55077.1 hypothetical protein ASF39_04925 [Methylobacterium sp. Leaf108]
MATPRSGFHRRPGVLLRAPLAGAILVGAVLGGCQSRSPETTGSIGSPGLGFGRQRETVSRRDVEALGERYAASPSDVGLALRYAQGLRATDQKPQAAAVLQQTALRNPKNSAVLAAYGKALSDVGRFTEAADVLQNAHTPARPDWRVLSAQGAVADQLGDHARAQAFYEAALKIQPEEPSVMSNLGLSYALARQLDPAEAILRRAAALPQADSRVRQNLALVLGLRGNFAEAEELSRRDLPPDVAAANTVALRALVARTKAPKSAAAPRSTAGAAEGANPASPRG